MSSILKSIIFLYILTFSFKAFSQNDFKQFLADISIEAEKKGISISDPDAREHVYGMPYSEWKEKYQK